MVSWTKEERSAIIKQLIGSAQLNTEDFKKLHEQMPDRTVRQIRDQYVKFLKPYILGLFSEPTSSSTGSTSPSTSSNSTPKKRICIKDEDDD